MESENVDNAEETSVLIAGILSLLMLGLTGVVVYASIKDNSANG